MTTVVQDPYYPNVVEATDDDLWESIHNAERRAGFTYEELAEQARTGQYASTEARLAWVAIGGLKEILTPDTEIRPARRGQRVRR